MNSSYTGVLDRFVIAFCLISVFPLVLYPLFTKSFSGTTFKMTDSKEDLKKKLTPLQYHVTQEKGTERPFTGEYDKFFDEGMYSCVVCGQELFSSKTKFDSGCGWPAFNDVINQGLVKLSTDTSLVGANLLLLIKPKPGMIRTEVQCAKCDAHMGHVFEDGPKPTRKRFCINSASLKFTPASTPAKSQ